MLFTRSVGRLKNIRGGKKGKKKKRKEEVGERKKARKKVSWQEKKRGTKGEPNGFC